MSELTAERLREVLHYDPETGVFTWLGRSRRRGLVAGYTETVGYHVIFVGTRAAGKLYKAHRLAWLYMTGEWPTDMIDHANGNKTDNRWVNLRAADRSRNLINSRRRRDNTTGFKGVSLNRGRYMASLTKGGKTMNLGRFDTAEEAHEAYCAAAREHFGEFARPD